MSRFKKASHIHVKKRHGSKRPRPVVVYRSVVSPSPFRKRMKVESTPSKIRATPIQLKNTSTRLDLLSPMICTPVNLPGSKTTSISKRKPKFDKGFVLNTISSGDVNDPGKLLKKLVQTDKFSTECISSKLFQDSLRWQSIQNTSSMRYSEEVKEFFWAGRRLLGGQFLRFMRGYAHTGKVTRGISPYNLHKYTISSQNLQPLSKLYHANGECKTKGGNSFDNIGVLKSVQVTFSQ